MQKKTHNIIFIFLFLCMIFCPLLFTRWEYGGISVEENRNLARFPELIVDQKINLSFPIGFDAWFKDHLGFREEMIHANSSLQQQLFHRTLSTSDVKIGQTGDYIYAPAEIIEDFSHVNLLDEDTLSNIGDSYQYISDWLIQKNIPFYYVQCVDKHTIYPERFIPHVRQLGSVSRTDQIIEYLQTRTNVHTIYFKDVLSKNRDQFDVFSHWGDSTHWTPRGAYIAYLHMMEQISQDLGQPLIILEETNYLIDHQTAIGPNGETEQIETFQIREPQAKKVSTDALGIWGSDARHSIWNNPNAGNNLRLLIMGDSYFNDYLVDDLAESFGEVWLVWGDYTEELPFIVEQCSPDLVIFECAERVDRSYNIRRLVNSMKEL